VFFLELSGHVASNFVSIILTSIPYPFMASTVDNTNDLVQIITVLFLLSLISERIAEFLKRYLSELKIFDLQVAGNTVLKSPPNSQEEEIRQYRILKINFFCGFITAFGCHASLFDILKGLQLADVNLGWGSIDSLSFDLNRLGSNLWFLLGCALTGCFISLGSKFWHDLLDIVVAIKDFKRSSTPSATEDFASLPQVQQRKILNAAINEGSDTWRNTFKNYKGVSVGYKEVQDGKKRSYTNQLAIRFNVSKKEDFSTLATNRVPTSIFYKGYELPTDVVPAGVPESSSGEIDPTLVPRPLGCSIGRNGTKDSGTLGVLMSRKVQGRKEYYGMSCYHVLFPNELKSKTRIIESAADAHIQEPKSIDSPSIIDNRAASINIGTVHEGTFSNTLDVGFFKTTSEKISRAVFDFGVPESTYSVTAEDELKLKLKFCGRTSGIVTDGTLITTTSKPVVRYFDRFDHEFSGFLQIRMIGKQGDSGAPILTQVTNRLVGIVVAVDEEYVYGLPVQHVINNFPYDFETLIS
jgi:hypothetical protein